MVLERFVFYSLLSGGLICLIGFLGGVCFCWFFFLHPVSQIDLVFIQLGSEIGKAAEMSNILMQWSLADSVK